MLYINGDACLRGIRPLNTTSNGTKVSHPDALYDSHRFSIVKECLIISYGMQNESAYLAIQD